MAVFIFPRNQVDTSGLATEAKQDTAISELQSIDAKLDSQATAANQSTANASLSTIAGDTTSLDAKLRSADVTEAHDYRAYTYVAAGNGAGKVETITYKSGGSGGSTVATQTFTYDANDRVSSIAKT